MDPQKYHDFLRQSLPNSKSTSGGKEVLTRCKYCSDSLDPRSPGHFYISVPQNENSLSVFNCFKCHTSGFVTYQRLLEWGIYDEAINAELIIHNEKALRAGTNRKYMDREIYLLRNNYLRRDKLSEVKLRYLNNRLGTTLSFEDILQKKIVLNLNDLLSSNNIEEKTRHESIIEQLDESFLGFISADNAFLNMRLLKPPGKVYSNIDKRYVNYNIFNKFDNTERFYTIPQDININRPERTKLHVSEGPFDILSIYYNLREQSKNDIFTCIAGSGYMGIVKHFISKMQLPYIELHLYPDNDASGNNYVMNGIVDMLRPLGTPVYVHRNIFPGEKDFGVSPSKIKEEILKYA